MVCAFVSYLRNLWKYPSGPVVRTRHFHCQGPGPIPGAGTKMLQASHHGQKEKEKRKKEIFVYLGSQF